MATAAPASPGRLDYYLVYASPVNGNSAVPEGILVEEFMLADDYSAAGLVSVGWSSPDRRWRASSDTSRRIRTDALLRRRVVPVARQTAEVFYRGLAGEDLPDEAALSAYCRVGAPMSMPAPLRLSAARVTAGFHETRLYRILFANELNPGALANLRAVWRMTTTGDPADPPVRVLGTAGRRIGGDAFSWDLRRLGAMDAWCVDLTVDLADSRDGAVGPLLRELTTTMRAQGLIPVTIDRFS